MALDRRLLNGSRLLTISILCLSVFLPWPTFAQTPQVAGARQPGKLQKLDHHVPEAVSHLRSLGRLPADQELRLAISLPLRNEPDLDRFLKEVYDPAGPIYHQFLVPEDFASRYGASMEDYQSLKDFAASNHLRVTDEHLNRLVLDVAGSVSNIESAFHIKLKRYTHPTEQREFFSPDTEPELNLDAPVLRISGLNNYSIRKPKYHPMNSATARDISPRAGSGPSSLYIGKDFRNAYLGTATNLTGKGQSVGLLQFDGFYASDISSYTNTAKFASAAKLNIVKVDGGVRSPGGGNGEVSLDITMVLSMAPGISNIYIYEAPNPSPWVDLLSKMANDNLAKQLSCSWGESTPGSVGDFTAEETIFKQMISQGQAFFNATGDSCAFVGGVPFPSESTNIIQVGATTLTTGSGAAYSSESVWNWGNSLGSSYNGVGSSGGISSNYTIPYWQAPISMALNGGSSSFRNVPDVAMVGDSIYNISGGGKSAGEVGGTSCAAPLWAAFLALVNQQASTNGTGTVGFINPSLYAIAAGTNYSSCFHDVTSGNNTWSNSPSHFYAKQGYDLCTGLGTPKGAALINALAPGVPIPRISAQPTNIVSVAGGTATFSVAAYASSPLSYSWFFNSNAIAQVTNSSLILTNVGPSDAGSYDVVVSNIYGSVTSSVANLTIVYPPTVTQSPVDTNVLQGQSALLTVQASGTATLAYQWRQNSNLLAGAYFATYSIPSAQAADAGYYDVLVFNSYGSVTSAVANVTVLLPPSFTQTPVDTNVVLGQPWSFNTAVSGTLPISYQWLQNSNILAGANDTNYSSASAQLSDAGSYTLVASNAYGMVTSTPANLSVITAPVIVRQPQSQFVYTGQSLNLTSIVLGAPPLYFQWSQNSNAITGATLPNYVKTNAQVADAGFYDLVISNAYGSVTSQVVSVTLQIPPAYAGILAGWDASTQTGGGNNFGVSPFLPSTNAPLLTVTPLTRGPGVGTAGIGLARAWGGTGFTNVDANSAFNSGLYFTFALTAPNGYSLNLSNISQFSYRRSTTAAPSGVLLCQVGSGTPFNITNLSYPPAALAGSNLPPIDLTAFASLQDIPAGTNVTFYIVNYGGSSAVSGWYINDTSNSVADDFEITGSLSPLSVPPVPQLQFFPFSTDTNNGSGVNLAFTNSSGSNYFVWSTLNPSLSVSNWVPAGQMSELPLADPPGQSIYSLQVTPSNSPTYYIAASAVNSAPYPASAYVQWIRFDALTNYTFYSTNAALDSNGFFSLPLPLAPVIVSNPVSSVILTGQGTLFQSVVSGDGLLYYQWLEGTQSLTDGGSVSGSQTPALTLLPATPGNAGAYSLVVTSMWGSVTSAPVNLTVLPVPALSAPQISSSGVTFSSSGAVPGSAYVVMTTTQLQSGTNSNWTPLSTNSADSNGGILFTDTNSILGEKFYRLLFP